MKALAALVLVAVVLVASVALVSHLKPARPPDSVLADALTEQAALAVSSPIIAVGLATAAAILAGWGLGLGWLDACLRSVLWAESLELLYI